MIIRNCQISICSTSEFKDLNLNFTWIHFKILRFIQIALRKEKWKIALFRAALCTPKQGKFLHFDWVPSAHKICSRPQKSTNLRWIIQKTISENSKRFFENSRIDKNHVSTVECTVDLTPKLVWWKITYCRIFAKDETLQLSIK